MSNNKHLFNGKRHVSVQTKIGGICIITNIIVFILDLVLVISMNEMSAKVERVYQENVELNVLSDALADVQDSMTAYLSVKTSDSLEDYYRDEQTYMNLISELNDSVTGDAYAIMERNIKHMSEQYLSVTSQTIEAKRGRNVEKYRIRYENATEIYTYIHTYINSLNNKQLQTNSENYVKLSRSFHSFEVIFLWMMVIVMIANILLTIKLAGTIIAPLKRLAVQADQIADGDFDIELTDTHSGDEIAIVTSAFNSMVVSIREYIEQVRNNMEVEQALRERELKMETHLREAELKYLQAQINPHFLFNTLNAGAQLAMMEDADRTYEYIQNMSEIFRYTVRKGDDTVSLREELELVDHYIFVLNVRFSGEIQYEKQIDESLVDIEMPSMILQPLVENSVNHGIREMEGKGKITVSVYDEGEQVCISVKDNGVGMSQEIIDKIMSGNYRKSDKPSGSNGIALDNVIARIGLFTERQDAIQILSEEDGTEVIIRIAYKKTEDKYV